MDNAKKNLLNGTFVYFIGNAAVAILQLIMLRFITGHVHTGGYGYYDTIVKVDNLITPILTLQISDAVFRNVLRGNQTEKIKAITNGSMVILAGIVMTVIGVLGIYYLYYPLPHFLLVISFIISTNIFAFYQKLARAVGANLSFIKSNLLKAFLYLFLQIVLIYLFNMKEESLFVATIASTAICLVYLEVSIGARKFISVTTIDFKYLKSMLKFSIPFVPNTVLWWFSNSVNSLLITARLGLDANGIFSIAGKFSSVIAMATSVFNLAWQESAIKEYGTLNGKAFYSEVYRMFYRVLCSAVFVCLPIMSILLPHMIDSSYFEAIKYAPLLVLGAGVSAAYGFFGQMYGATGKTNGAAVTTFFGVITNLMVIFSSIDRFGLWSPCVAMILSGLVILAVRYYQFREEMKLKITKELMVLVMVIVLATIIYYSGSNVLNYICLVFGSVLALFANRDLLSDAKNIVMSRIKK